MGWPEARAGLRLARVAGRIGLALVLALFVAPRLDPAGRARLVQRWARGTLHTLGIALVANPPPRIPGLVVSNHVSWLDVLAIAAAHPAAFVAKHEVRAWPILGAIAARTGTIFIERRRRRDVVAVNAQILARLNRGHSVAVFPEGTTTDGSRVLAFRSALLEPARAARRPVHPVAVSYRKHSGSRSYEVAFVGEQGFVGSLCRIARTQGLEARLQFLESLAIDDAPRQAVATMARERIELALATGA